MRIRNMEFFETNFSGMLVRVHLRIRNYRRFKP